MSNQKNNVNVDIESKKQVSCLICGSETRLLSDKQIKVTYAVCDNCGFIYKNKKYHLNYDDEYREYNNHNNSFESIGYVKMFERFIEEHIDNLNIQGKVLEYGSGPGPVLKELLRRKGFDIYDYDPFYNPNKEYLDNKYDLITSTEVVEHFYDPIREFKHIASLLSKDGYLVIMTSLNNFSEREFLNWSYRREASHVSFFTIKALEFISKITCLKIVNHNDKNVIVFQKQ